MTLRLNLSEARTKHVYNKIPWPQNVLAVEARLKFELARIVSAVTADDMAIFII